MRNIRSILGAVLAGLSFAAPQALAHHSFAQFDTTKELTMEGTVQDFQWSNPHVWIDIMTTNSKGEPQKWGLETQSVGILFRQGWRQDSLKPGDKITVQLHPMRDGSSGGQLMKITFPDGRVLVTAMARPGN